ncbi:MAG: hypothetical protein N2037_02320 [Acidimicrobiales bacterium]|nr:hypothetical protein [Acidimicrobiales bacterium]
MRFTVETWAPEYSGAVGAPDAVPEAGTTVVDPNVELPVAEWRPIAPLATSPVPAPRVLFIDGVRRVEATVWISDDGGAVHRGLCASYAAGVVVCDGIAQIVECRLERGLFCSLANGEPIRTRRLDFGLHVVAGGGDALMLAIQKRMARLEVEVAAAHRGEASTIVVDGPLRDGHDDPDLVGYIKTHAVAYGPAIVSDVVAALEVGQRTPLMLLGVPNDRFSWYLRLPGPKAHGWSGIVRLEVLASRSVQEVVAKADALARELPRFASAAHKDPRAPQNLYPIAGLERELRRRLGDAAFVLRELREAATLT